MLRHLAVLFFVLILSDAFLFAEALSDRNGIVEQLKTTVVVAAKL